MPQSKESSATPDENVYKALLRAKVVGALQTARATKGITHSGLKGRVREIIIGDLFRPLLPADVSIASGQIVSCKEGRLSRQHDVILFDGALLPPINFDSSAAIIPIEAVLYTIEIKSLLTKEALKDAHDSARELRTECTLLKGATLQNGKKVEFDVPSPNSVLFALESDLKGDPISEIKRYREVYGKAGPFLQAMCVAGKGYWYEHQGSWVVIKGNHDGDDVLAFIAGVMNTYKLLSAGRGIQAAGNYLIKGGAPLTTYPSGTKPTLRIACEKCGEPAICSFNREMAEEQHWTEGFVDSAPCHKCGGRVVAEPGTYVLKDGLYERQAQ